MRSRRSAFTLIELLVVMTIIAILATMSLGGISLIRQKLNDNQTSSRIEACLTAFTQLGQGEGSGAMVIQRDAGLDGVLGWRQSKTDPPGNPELVRRSIQGGEEYTAQTLPDENYWTNRHLTDPFASTRKGTDWSGIAWADKDQGGKDDGSRPYLRFPWGEMIPQELLPSGQFSRATTRLPDTFYLRHCSPHKTREILTVAGVVPRALDATVKKYQEYMTDRSPKRDWNDAWGYPLVVAFAMYQPPINDVRNNLNNASNNQVTSGKDVILSVCRDKYKRTRTIYLSLAAIGPVLPSTISDTALTSNTESKWTGANGIPYLIWQRVVGDGTPVSAGKNGMVGVCQQGEAAKVGGSGRTPPACTTGEWTEKSWGNPPWQGVKIGKYVDPKDNLSYRCFLSHPTPLN